MEIKDIAGKYYLFRQNEVQKYQDKEWFDDEAVAVTNENLLSIYGQGAILIPISRIDEEEDA